jgi:hypothetical protein
MFQLMVHVE